MPGMPVLEIPVKKAVQHTMIIPDNGRLNRPFL
jgi:hypothetical protein